MSAGSNMTATLEDGREIRYYDVQVFTCGTDSPYWQMYVCRRELPPATKSLALSPLASGPGRALFDNLRLTVYGGTDYAAECYRAKSPVKIDGKLDDWVTACPIPLIGKNQLTVVDPSYKWTPQNLNGVAYLMWDDTNLYVAAQVRDDVHHTVGTGDDAIKGDSLILAFDPTNRSPEAAQKAFAYYVSAAAPGGGSGAHTIYRPEALSGGLRSGQLFRDSSIYEIVVSKGEGTCVYEMRIPISELGGIQPGFGAKFGFSIQLNDSDGKGLEAHMNWGDGISPSWAPGRFGLVTLVE
jgi:hypothetical protein